ncbi:MAG: hypothetical protein K6E38_05750 [Fretibacterium sp.]|nr:hypothetical protein [Fretibacterium sp.]
MEVRSVPAADTVKIRDKGSVHGKQKLLKDIRAVPERTQFLFTHRLIRDV